MSAIITNTPIKGAKAKAGTTIKTWVRFAKNNKCTHDRFHPPGTRNVACAFPYQHQLKTKKDLT
ncbi:hypothetical protein DBR40_10325 [Pedobacter sp. KBW01]|nr:hypothetical protein DBR40_10325 [Pedobacter sp. KBW01]